ncbi:phage tail sheath family protein [Cohnella lupini]|uniref:Tail sheath protein n=1 Tax=Cohnella lupini TaxID=1294267 RepID=A0A3D9IT26_9BACL|nr:phage tail sheath family protein [Cohnella lupini]RED64669.1 tail sheath protein [Cohnella lupini]
MAGGTWVTQNKVRPGVYINFEGDGQPLGKVGEKGVVALALSLSWGRSKQIMTIQSGETLTDKIGYDQSAPEALLIREALKRAKTLLLYRLNEGAKATATQGTITFTARYAGIRGNAISIIIEDNVDDNTKFDVKTLVSGEIVDIQTVLNVASLSDNGWVDFGGTGTLSTSAGIPLTGGTDGAVLNQDYSDFLTAIEVHDFNTVVLSSADNTLKSLYGAFVKRLRQDEGRKVQAVLADYAIADHEGIISVKNGVVLSDGTILDAVKATAWVAGATAGAEMSESLTYQAYDDAVDADIRYTHTEIEAALKGGHFVFVQNRGRAIVELDINTFRDYSPTKGKAFSKNRVIRVMDGIANDFKSIFENFYIGKVDNNIDGRNLLKAECLSYLNILVNDGIIQNFNAQTDLQVLPGVETDSVYVELNIQPVDAIEKVYMKVKVK